jgi:hypothetical protein
MVFENKVNTIIFGSKGRELQEAGAKCRMKNFLICYPQQNIITMKKLIRTR